MEFPKQLKDIVYKLLQEPTLDNFREFIHSQMGEHNAIDFKGQWIEGAALAKEILALANSKGGIIVFGVAENEDKTTKIDGLSEIRDKAVISNDIKNYILPIVILSLLGTVVTYVYIRLVAKECFKGFEHEFFLMSFGTMTGTASNGMILMKEVDPGLRTPTSSLYILSNFPAMIMIAPLLFLLNFAGQSLTNTFIAMIVFFLLWFAYTVFLFRRKIFKKRYDNVKPVVWSEEN